MQKPSACINTIQTIINLIRAMFVCMPEIRLLCRDSLLVNWI